MHTYINTCMYVRSVGGKWERFCPEANWALTVGSVTPKANYCCICSESEFTLCTYWECCVGCCAITTKMFSCHMFAAKF